MVTETEKSLKILAETEMRPILGISDDGSSNGEDLGKEEGEMNLYRSGSAPPTVEGSLTAVGGLFSHGGDSSASASVSEAEEELRSDPSYLSYYYSNVNLNPRLPPPLLSKEDWRFARRSSVLGGIGDRRNVNQVDEMGSRSLFSLQPGFNSHLEESEIDSRKQQVLAEWGTDGLIGLPDLGLGSRRNSFADIFQYSRVSRSWSFHIERESYHTFCYKLGDLEGKE